ncbi:spore germination protein [Brevibacillus porteri]|uniref:spore germination protein n=1 Tax=Brevibacillus porteri TaxID=2126350 RepID=UPI0036448DA4
MKENFLIRMEALMNSCADVQRQQFADYGKSVHLFYQSALIDMKRFREFVVPRLIDLLEKGETGWTRFQHEMGAAILVPTLEDSEISDNLFNGKLLVYLERESSLISLDISKKPARNPEETPVEPTMRGARDGFVEELDTNIALVRKRLSTEKLNVQMFAANGLQRTRVALLYVSDRVPPETLDVIRKRLLRLQNTTLTGGSGRLEDIVSDNRYSLFQLNDYTGRPDFAAERLLRGKFLLIFEGTPTVTIGPSTLADQFLSPEDSYYHYIVATVGRLIRFICFFIAFVTPGFYIALLMYNQDQIPFPLLATIGLSRNGIPIPAILEMLLILVLLDMFREAIARLPTPIGSTITVVGGFIIGDAALKSGVLSPGMTYVAAFSFVAGSTIVNISLQGAVRILRLFVLLFSAFLGIYGTVLALLFLLVYLLNLHSYGAPFFPSDKINLKNGFFRFVRLPFSKKGLSASKHSEGGE